MKKSAAVFPLVAIVALLFAFPCRGASWLDIGKNVVGNLLQPSATSNTALSQQDVIAGLKETLRVAGDNVIGKIGVRDGFYKDPAIHIPLPEKFRKAQVILNSLHLSPVLDDLETRLNRAAEEATPKTKEIFWQAIKEMSFDDAMRIYRGPDDAATTYFKEKTTPALTEAIRPVINRSLQDAGAVQLYDSIIGKYEGLPLVPDLKSDLTAHVSKLTLDGIFHYLAGEEAAIRHDPAKRTTQLLQKLFSSNQTP